MDERIDGGLIGDILHQFSKDSTLIHVSAGLSPRQPVCRAIVDNAQICRCQIVAMREFVGERTGLLGGRQDDVTDLNSVGIQRLAICHETRVVLHYDISQERVCHHGLAGTMIGMFLPYQLLGLCKININQSHQYNDILPHLTPAITGLKATAIPI